MISTLAASDTAVWAIPLGSAVIAIITLIYAAIGVRGAADAKHVAYLEKELEIHERRLAQCEDDRKVLRGEVDRLGKREIELMRLVVNLEARSSGQK